MCRTRAMRLLDNASKNKPFEHCSIISFGKLDTTISTHSTNIRIAVQKSCCSCTDSITAFHTLRCGIAEKRLTLICISLDNKRITKEHICYMPRSFKLWINFPQSRTSLVPQRSVSLRLLFCPPWPLQLRPSWLAWGFRSFGSPHHDNIS